MWSPTSFCCSSLVHLHLVWLWAQASYMTSESQNMHMEQPNKFKPDPMTPYRQFKALGMKISNLPHKSNARLMIYIMFGNNCSNYSSISEINSKINSKISKANIQKLLFNIVYMMRFGS